MRTDEVSRRIRVCLEKGAELDSVSGVNLFLAQRFTTRFNVGDCDIGNLINPFSGSTWLPDLFLERR
jgi:hypothetical protein